MILGPLIVGIEGRSLDPADARMLGHPAVGGVILFSRNYRDPQQLTALCAEIRGLRSPRLLVCVDQEGGRVQRFRAGFTPLPPLSVLGRWYRSRPERACDLAYRHGRVMAAEVLGHGVDLSLAPVLDLDRGSAVIGDRAMSAEPDAVIALAGHYLAGMRDAGMAACAKHFPGHGSVAADTHIETVVDRRDLAGLADDLAPYRALAAELPAVMPAHVHYPAVEDCPAGFSARWLKGILRGELGFSGAIISDDLDMAAACTAGGPAEGLAACLAAGCDLVLVCRPDSARSLLDGLPAEGANWADRAGIIGKLYGRPAFSLADQATVPEFRAWRDSLRALAETA